MNTRKKISQIIAYVYKKEFDQAICAFRTNLSEYRPDIWFTYLDYEIEASKISDYFMDNKDNVFLLTDDPKISRICAEEGIAFAGITSSDNYFENALYCIEDLENTDFDSIEKMWKRCHNIPWIILETERLIVREQDIMDVDRLYEIYSDPDISRNVEGLKADKNQEIQYMKDYIKNQYRFFEFGLWALVDKESGKVIGRAGLSTRDGFDDFELGYVIACEYREKGLAYEACRAILAYMSAEYGINRVQAFVKHGNFASIGLIKKLGFDYVGVCKINGEEYERYFDQIC